MIFDKTLQFSDQQAITATAASTNAIDLGAMGTAQGAATALKQDSFKSTKVPLLVQVTADFTSSAGTETLKIDIELDSTDTFTPDKTITLGTFTSAELKAGFQIPWTLLPQGVSLRYARLKYTVAGAGNFTGGKITAGVVAGVQTNGV